MTKCYKTMYERKLICDGQAVYDNPANHPDILKKAMEEAKRTGVYNKVVANCMKAYPDSLVKSIGASINMPMDKRMKILQGWRDACIRNRLAWVTKICQYKTVPVKYEVPCNEVIPARPNEIHNHPNPPHRVTHKPAPKPVPKPQPKPQPTHNPVTQVETHTEEVKESVSKIDNKTKLGLIGAAGALLAYLTLR